MKKCFCTGAARIHYTRGELFSALIFFNILTCAKTKKKKIQKEEKQRFENKNVVPRRKNRAGDDYVTWFNSSHVFIFITVICWTRGSKIIAEIQCREHIEFFFFFKYEVKFFFFASFVVCMCLCDLPCFVP